MNNGAKHSSLLRYGTSYSCKRYKTHTPGINIIHILTLFKLQPNKLERNDSGTYPSGAPFKCPTLTLALSLKC